MLLKDCSNILQIAKCLVIPSNTGSHQPFTGSAATSYHAAVAGAGWLCNSRAASWRASRDKTLMLCSSRNARKMRPCRGQAQMPGDHPAARTGCRAAALGKGNSEQEATLEHPARPLPKGHSPAALWQVLGCAEDTTSNNPPCTPSAPGVSL